MAEESVDPLIIITPGENESVSNKMIKTSVENPPSPNARSKKPDSANIIHKTVPNYLRASTGSCHDFCKFGRKHASDEMPTRKPLRLRTAKSVEIVVLDKQNKDKVVKNEPSADNTKKHSVVVKPSFSKPRQNAASSSRTKSRFPTFSPNEKSTASNPPEIIKREIILPPSRKVEVIVREGNKTLRTDKKAYDDHSARRSSSVMHEKPVKVKTSSISDKRRYSDVQMSRKMTSSSTVSAKKALMPIASPSSPKFVRSKITSVKARKTGTTLKLLSPMKDAIVETSNGEDCEKILHVVEIGMEKNVVESPSLPNFLSGNPESPALLSCGKDDEVIKYIGDKVEDVFVSDNIVKPSKESHEYSGNELTDEFVAEDNATEAIIMTKSLSLPNSPSLLSLEEEEDDDDDDDDEDEEDIEQSDSEANESVSNKTISTEISKIETAKQNQNKTLRKTKVGLSENKHHSPIKLKFRSGKTVDPQPENNTPRRLKFRKARVITNKPDDFAPDKNNSIEINTTTTTKDAKVNQNRTSIKKNKSAVSEDKYRAPRSPVKLFKSQRRVDHQYSDIKSPTRLKFSKSRVQRGEDSKSGDLRKTLRKSGGRDDGGNSVISSRKVVLKHQDLEGKKDDKGLLNNVIEETASKLVETRKSKVKALVGAFETVISLQERKPR